MSASQYLPNLHRGPAAYRNQPSSPSHKWELIVSTVQLFISGPGPQAWCACSKPNYEPGSKAGTPQERAIAQRALLILIKRHWEDMDAGVSHIQEALALAAKQYAAALLEAPQPLTA